MFLYHVILHAKIVLFLGQRSNGTGGNGADAFTNWRKIATRFDVNKKKVMTQRKFGRKKVVVLIDKLCHI